MRVINVIEAGRVNFTITRLLWYQAKVMVVRANEAGVLIGWPLRIYKNDGGYASTY